MVAPARKRARLVLATAIAAAALTLGAAPASASKCDPDGVCPQCDNPIVNNVMRKVFGVEFECA